MPNQSNSTKGKTECDPIKDEKCGRMREVGSQAVWSLSSCKPGEGLLGLFGLIYIISYFYIIIHNSIETVLHLFLLLLTIM